MKENIRIQSNKYLLVDVTTLIKWSRSPVGIIRTQLEFVHYLLQNDTSAKYFKFNDEKDTLFEVSTEDISKQVEKLLNFKNPPSSKKDNSSLKRMNSKSFISLELFKKIKHIYKYEGVKSLFIKTCNKICPAKIKDKLKKIYFYYKSDGNKSSRNVQLDQENSLETLFSPETLQAKSFNFDLLTKEAIIISIGLDWDNSNYPLLYWLKKKIDFTFIGAFYDAIPVVHPELVQSDYFSKMFFSHIYYLLHLSDKVFCISDFSKNQLEDICHKHQIHNYPVLQTIHLGDSIFKKETTSSDKSRKHKKDYVLYVSTIEARKNHIVLLRVWQELQKQNMQNLPDLVLVGMYGWGVDDLHTLYNNDKKLQENVHFYDDVDDEELVEIYKDAKFTVFPSFLEGWGLGAVESLLYGKPCIISDCPALVEATQGLMPSVAADDIEGWIEAIKLFNNEESKLIELKEIIKKDFKSRKWSEFSEEFSDFAKEVK